MKKQSMILAISLVLLWFFMYQQLNPKKVIREGNLIDDIIQPIKDGFEKMWNDMVEGIMSVVRPIIDICNEIGLQFNLIPVRFKLINSGFKKSGMAIGLEFKNLGIALDTGFNDTFDLIGMGGKMGVEYILCGLDKLLNLPLCIIFYVFDMCRAVFGWFFRSLICAIEIYFDLKNRFGIDLDKKIDAMKERMLHLDDYVYKFSGFHVFRYPEYIENHCYKCNMNTLAKQVTDQAKQVNYDFYHYLPELMREPAYLFREAGDDFRNLIKKHPNN